MRTLFEINSTRELPDPDKPVFDERSTQLEIGFVRVIDPVFAHHIANLEAPLLVGADGLAQSAPRRRH